MLLAASLALAIAQAETTNAQGAITPNPVPSGFYVERAADGKLNCARHGPGVFRIDVEGAYAIKRKPDNGQVHMYELTGTALVDYGDGLHLLYATSLAVGPGGYDLRGDMHKTDNMFSPKQGVGVFILLKAPGGDFKLQTSMVVGPSLIPIASEAKRPDGTPIGPLARCEGSILTAGKP